MGKQIHLRKIEALFEKSPVVEFKSLERVIGKSKNSSYAKLAVHNLLKTGKIKKLGKGVYTKHNNLSLAVFSFKPSYLGLQSALSHHGVWDQATVPIIITTKGVRTGLRLIMGGNVLVRRIQKKYFFGSEYLEESDFYLPYSDLEKTFIDMVVFNQNIDEESLGRLKKRVNYQKLFKYLRQYPSKISERVLKLVK